MHQTLDPDKIAARKENISRIKNKIIVMSGKGGVGKSTVSVNLAYALSKKGKTGLLDIDFHGPSVGRMTGTENRKIYSEGRALRVGPLKINDNLYVLSLASLMESPDQAVVWRGPMKMGVINQFFEEFDWPVLDYLVVDCPPGTGDEPLSIIQTLGENTGCVIVTTPQDVALNDARKSIDFAKKLELPIYGIIENMAGFVCPHCGTLTDIFKTGGADRAAADFSLEIIGKLPLDPSVVHSGDDGKPFIENLPDSISSKEILKASEIIRNKITKNTKS
jgi:Mrp family chromosome partitioning ATPase